MGRGQCSKEFHRTRELQVGSSRARYPFLRPPEIIGSTCLHENFKILEAYLRRPAKQKGLAINTSTAGAIPPIHLLLIWGFGWV